jgi:hypothetical protein
VTPAIAIATSEAAVGALGAGRLDPEMGGAILWFFEHTIGWAWDHTLGALVARSKRKDRQRDDLGTLADELSAAVSQCSSLGRGYSVAWKYAQSAHEHAERAFSLSTRVPDADLGKLVKAARDGINAYAEDFMSGKRERYSDPTDAALERIRELQRGLR